MKLPNGHRAYVDIKKLRDYCFSESHLTGKHKARVFRAALGWGQENEDELLELLIAAADSKDSIPGKWTSYGQLYTVDIDVDGLFGPITIRSGWIVRKDEDFPRLTTCYVL